MNEHMDQEERRTETPVQPPEQLPEELQKKRNPHDRKMRAWAWVGIAFMVFLTIMYFYSFYSGSVLLW